ncbi:hypothetical protein BDV95DRAFT_607404 [Massariosphaeria phaeospora]|uniref:Rhodopsin domain-containing protein n=1 Tax=Massariosphaeria phaeospora TaxID=100035 RepID=A0A7C8MJX6_9PLEO|nr:hypothetical protein BDV95DRAFT_607404 [Massariosphaeria phaeospora]
MDSLTRKTPGEMQAFLEGPSREPPPGIQSNFVDPDNLNTPFIILCTIGTVVTGLFMAMRFYTRYMLTRRLILEDLVLFTGWALFAFGINTALYQAMKYNLGAHMWDIPVQDLVEYLRLFHHGTLLFCVSMLLLRVAIIMQIIRHFVPQGARDFTYWMAHTLIGLNTLFWLTVTMLEIFSCRPREKLWKFYAEGTCIDRHAYLIAGGVMNLGSELLLMILPQRVIWNLALSTKQKLELTPLFLTGTLTCICSSVRLYQTVIQWPTTDISYYIADAILLWTVPEVACSVLVSCLPSIPQFVRIIRKQATSNRRDSTILEPRLTPSRSKRRTNRSWGGSHGKTSPGAIVSDLEYHELVMCTETTIDIVDREDTGPWVQPPATIHVTGGRGPTKTFSAPTVFTR